MHDALSLHEDKPTNNHEQPGQQRNADLPTSLERFVNSLRPSDAYICVMSPGRRQAIIWTNAGILLIGPLRTNSSEILSEIHSRKCIWKCRLRNGVHFVSAAMC